MSRVVAIERGKAGPATREVIRRFSWWACVTHGVLALSVFGLVFTGMPLKYAGSAWAGVLMRMWGGARTAGLFHRGFALVFFLSAVMHVAGVAAAAVRRRLPPLTGPDSLVLGPEDARHLVQYLRHLRGKGEAPRFGRFTYWEKFDYLAEGWGMLVIGLTGLVMWFPEKAASFLPGWAVNAALIFHSYEALLAAAFLFAIHFFNTHLRPEVFPVDPVIFTGRLSVEEARERYPGWYGRLRAGQGPAIEVEVEASRRSPAVVSGIFLTLGIIMLLLVMSAAIAEATGYLLEYLD